MHGLARVQGLKVFYSDHFVLPLPEGHRFPMVKYSILRERVAASAAAVSIFPRVTFLEKSKS
jgi:hypothetical protein